MATFGGHQLLKVKNGTFIEASTFDGSGAGGLSLKRSGAFGNLGSSVPEEIILPAIGDAFMGGYYAGIIDTTQGNIIAADASQVGARYALIVSPKSLQIAKRYKSTSSFAPSATRTRWDGLTATTAMAADAEIYYAADYCAGLTYPTDDASSWYMPALDELEMLYRHFKPYPQANLQWNINRAAGPLFPDTVAPAGENISSDPPYAGYTSGSPAQTTVLAFKAPNGSERFTFFNDDSTMYFRSSTESSQLRAWTQAMNTAGSGFQYELINKDQNDEYFCVRPVRRLILPPPPLPLIYDTFTGTGPLRYRALDIGTVQWNDYNGYYWNIVNNKARMWNTGDVDNVNLPSGLHDLSVSADITWLATLPSKFGLLLRSQNGGFRIVTYFNGTSLFIDLVNLSYTVTRSVSVPFTSLATDQICNLKLTAVGDLITAYVDEVSKLTMTLTGPEFVYYSTETAVGLYCTNGTSEGMFDEFKVFALTP